MATKDWKKINENDFANTKKDMRIHFLKMFDEDATRKNIVNKGRSSNRQMPEYKYEVIISHLSKFVPNSTIYKEFGTEQKAIKFAKKYMVRN